MSLSSLIVERGIASIREIEEALARQVLYGGDLVTNLLEVSRIEEAALMPVVAESFGLALAPVGELPRAPDGTIHVVAPQVAAEHGFATLEYGITLLVAVAAPLSAEAEQELSFTLGMRIRQRIAPMFRIRQALARDFGIPFDKRIARLLQKIVNKGPRIASTIPPPMDAPPKLPPRPPSQMPPPPKLPSVAPPPPTSAAPSSFVRPGEPPSVRPPRRRRGPMTLEQAQTELEASVERDVVFDVFFEFARQFFDYTVLFVSHGDVAEGRDAFGDGTSRDRVVRIGVPLSEPGMLRGARETQRTLRAIPSKHGADAVLTSDLGRDGTTACVVVPVVVRKRVVAMLLGDGGATGLDDDGVAQVERLAIAAAGAFERVIVRRKLKAAEAPSEGGARAAMKKAESIPPPQISSAPPIRLATGPFTSLDLPAAVLPTLLEPRIEDRPAIEELAAPIRELLAEPPVSLPVVTSREPTPQMLTPDPAMTTSDLPPPANLLAVRRPTGAPIPREEPTSREGREAVTLPPASTRTKSGSMHRAAAPPLEFGTPAVPSVVGDGFGADAMERSLLAQIQGAPFQGGHSDPPITLRDPNAGLDMPVTSTLEWPVSRTAVTEPPASPKASSPPPTAVTAPVAPPRDRPLPAIPHPDPDEGDPERTPLAPAVYDLDATPIAPAAEPVIALSQRKGAPRVVAEPKPMPASEQIVSVPAHKPPSPRSEDEELPSIIVDVAGEYAGLVDRVLASNDEEAETELLRAGGHAMPAIMARFPGPIVLEPERFDGPLPRVAEAGPILRLIAGQRRTALPFMLGDVTSLDAERRFWATYLLTELVYPDAIEPAVGRLFDENARVRRAARTAVRALAEAHPQAVVDRIAMILKDDRKRGLRVKAIEALGESREPLAIPVLLPLVAGDEGELAAAARSALVTITRQDHHLDGARWGEWWEANKGRHRLEWLIDSLMSEQRSLRGAAIDELRAITKEYFGYYDDLPKRERAASQARWRDWWETIGRVRFSRAASRGA